MSKKKSGKAVSAYENINITCPYFHKLIKYGIVCEGFSARATLLQRFPSVSARRSWQRRYCICYLTDPRRCPISQLHEDYYNTGVLQVAPIEKSRD